MSMQKPDALLTAILTTVTMVAFASNSVLCRLALAGNAIDAVSFTTVRLSSGAAMLWLLSSIKYRKKVSRAHGSWRAAFMLFTYAIMFSIAYIQLSAGTGALILFAAVQATMILAGLRSGERPHPVQWAGLFLSLGGLVYLVSPGLTAPSAVGAACMSIAGIAWGVYSMLGRGADDPVSVTTGNFIRAVPPALIVSIVMLSHLDFSAKGLMLALTSGALTSGLGYVLWYAALRGLTATRAAIVQLTVPLLAAGGGILFLSETVSLRLAMSSVLILGGVGLAVAAREHFVKPAARATD